MNNKNEIMKLLCRALLCVAKSLVFIFLQVSFIVRDGEVSVVRERERNLFTTPRFVRCFCRNDSDCLYQLFSPMYFLPVACTITIDFDQFEFQLMLDQNQFLLPRSSELQVLGIWRRSSELLVFRVFGTWSSESSSLQKLETFIRTSVFRIFST